MLRYISTDEFEKRIKPYDTNDPIDKAMYNFAHIIMLSTSTANVVEMKKGIWKNGRCSECGYNWGEVAPLAIVPKFCPNCAAIMKGKKDDETNLRK